MKKIISLGLVVVMIFGLGIMSFADSESLTESEVYKVKERRGDRLSNGFRRSPRKLSQEVIETHAELLSSLIDLDTDEILNNDLRLHELAEDYDVLDEFHKLIVQQRINQLEALVEAGEMTQEQANLMIERIQNREGFMGPNNEGGLSQGRGRKVRLFDDFYEKHVTILATLIDLSEDDIKDSDDRLYDLAKDYDVSDELHELLIIEKTEALEAFVQEGKITQERADEMLAGMEDRDGRGPRSMRQMPISRRELN